MIDVAVPQISLELQLSQGQVQATARLLDDGATVPFIAPYRKEATASLDEVAVTSIRDRLSQLRELRDRREAILASLEERGLLTEELRKAALSAETMAALEDIYLPYRPKRRTRATIAREKGLEPLALHLWDQEDFDVNLAAVEYVNPELGVEKVEDATECWPCSGVRERRYCRSIWRRPSCRRWRSWMGSSSLGKPKPRNKSGWRFRIPTSGCWNPPWKRSSAKKLEFALSTPPSKYSPTTCGSRFWPRPWARRTSWPWTPDSAPAANWYAWTGRVGCCTTISSIPCWGHGGEQEAAKKVGQLCYQYHVEAIAVGNGTGGRETEAFLRRLELGPRIPVVMVNESGASVYSASEVARTEFPEEDITVRGAVSIGRRLMDPLAELVKIEPKAIGVGQYQHDVDQKALKERLDDVVGSCVTMWA